MYLYNPQKFSVELPTGEVLLPGTISAKITATDNALPGMQELFRSNLVQILQSNSLIGTSRSNTKTCYMGEIYNSGYFPSPVEVRTGHIFNIASDTIDNSPDKTNTGTEFTQGQTIMWLEGAWIIINECIIP